MFKREEIEKILQKAARIDSKCSLFGAEKHRYKLNAPIDAPFVRNLEEKYNFTLPDDYFRFITEVGDGGAGPDYGIYPFTRFSEQGSDEYAKEYLNDYRFGVAKPFMPRRVTAAEVEDCGLSKAAYDREPEKFFVFEEYCEEYGENICCDDGFFVIGTRGCQYDFGIITAGEYHGQVFETNNEGTYIFSANSFTEFYRQWLDRISDRAAFKKEIDARRKLFKRK